jgi:hypothetical protein
MPKLAINRDINNWQSEYTSAMSQSAGTLKSVVLWSLPSYAALTVLIALAFAASSIPLGAQRTVEGVWMFAALFLPISTILAMVKALHLSFRAGDEAEVRLWQSIVGWSLVAVVVPLTYFPTLSLHAHSAELNWCGGSTSAKRRLSKSARYSEKSHLFVIPVALPLAIRQRTSSNARPAPGNRGCEL